MNLHERCCAGIYGATHVPYLAMRYLRHLAARNKYAKSSSSFTPHG